MKRLKADLHLHTSDDPCDQIDYSAEMLIDAVAENGLDVMAITCHTTVIFNEYLADYARQRGVLLIPAAELNIEEKHVLLLNPDADQARATTFAELRRLGKRDAAIIAPHAYFPIGSALGRKLAENIDLFDAIEYHSFYNRIINCNRKAKRTARKHGLPMVGSTDTHTLPYDPSTYTWIEAEPTVPSIINAIRSGRIGVETRPRSFSQILDVLRFSFSQELRDRRPTSKHSEATQ